MQIDIPAEFDLSQLLAEIPHNLPDPGPDYHAVAEWAQFWRVSESKARKEIAKLVAAGVMAVEKRGERATDGRVFMQRVYKVVPPAERGAREAEGGSG